jgi:hypothetical protein
VKSPYFLKPSGGEPKRFSMMASGWFATMVSAPKNQLSSRPLHEKMKANIDVNRVGS